MMTEQSHLIFQSYGNEGVFYECLFALVSLAQQHTDEELSMLDIHIYTDKPEWFQALNIGLKLNYHQVDQHKIKQWKGAIDFVHRVKIEVLRDFVRDHKGAVLYLDTDVYFLKSVSGLIKRINEGALYMHVMEAVVAHQTNPILSKLNAFLTKNNPLHINRNSVTVSTQTAMWNAGVLGFHTNNTGILEDVLAFTDTVFPMFPKHIVEQFAFSYYFQQKGNVHHAAAHILHYWNLKELRPLLASFFRYVSGNTWQQKVKASTALQVTELLQDKLNFYMNRSMTDKLKGKHWTPVIPDWEQLMKQA